MVPLAQPLLPRTGRTQSVVAGRGDIAAHHSQQIERHAKRGPTVLDTEAPVQKDHAEGHAQQYARSMAPAVPQLLSMGIEWLHQYLVLSSWLGAAKTLGLLLAHPARRFREAHLAAKAHQLSRT